MHEIAAPSDEARREPALGFGRGGAPDEARFEPLLVGAPAPREASRTDLTLSVPSPVAPEPPGSGRPVQSRKWRRPVGATLSLLLHLLALALILERPMPKPAEIEPIPVQLVIEPPPAPKPPEPKPLPPKPEVKPPSGRIASEDIGDTTKEPRKEAAPAPPEAKPSEPEQQTAELEPEKPAQPKGEVAPKPLPKPKPAARQPPRRATEQRAHLAPRPARYPGPAATRDEYLAYLAWLARQHIRLLPLSLVGNRRGETVVNILVLGDGTIATLRVGRSSGWHDIDLRVEQMIAAVGRFPPLPQWYQGPSMQLEFRLRFPEALLD